MSETISGVPYSVVVSILQDTEGCQTGGETRCLILKLVEYVLIVIALSTIIIIHNQGCKGICLLLVCFRKESSVFQIKLTVVSEHQHC